MGKKDNRGGDGVISPRRFAIICGTVIAAVAGFGLAGIKNTHTPAIEERATKTGEAGSEAESAAAAVTAIAESALPDASQMLVPETQPEQIAAASTPELAYADDKEAASSAETLNESLSESSQMLPPETQAVQIATVSKPDPLRGGGKETVSSTETLDESLSYSSQTFASETPSDAKETVNSTETRDECLTREVCIDQYLWSVYQRTPKQDTVKVVEQRKMTVKTKGKSRTIIKEFTKLVDEDFTWKDPKAAEKASKSLMEYVIGGMDQGFKLKLYHALRAMDEAGLSPGITSAFRDDYRQSLTTGLKAATDRSYHGGSFRGGYGHGLAVDLVSVKGENRAERLISSENLWKWIDAHGKELGIGRPYLDKDPPHVAPIDGKEYADHSRGANTQHARPEIKKRNLLAVRDNHSIANLARTAKSSNF
jgi:hypothetical protein